MSNNYEALHFKLKIGSFYFCARFLTALRAINYVFNKNYKFSAILSAYRELYLTTAQKSHHYCSKKSSSMSYNS